jgi:hypothetical protein
VGHEDGDVDDDEALGAYGGIVDVAAHVPTVTGAITAAIAAGLCGRGDGLGERDGRPERPFALRR